MRLYHLSHLDPKIFGKGAAFKPARLFRMARSKAYLFRGVTIRWSCDKFLRHTVHLTNIHDARGKCYRARIIFTYPWTNPARPTAP